MAMSQFLVRACTPGDLEEIKRIHDKYYAETHELPDFMQFLCAFVIEDEQGLITAGGIRDVAECIAVTNKERHAVDRARALYQLRDMSAVVCKEFGYDRMHIWTQDPKYTKRLQKLNFRIPPGQSLILDL